MLSVGVCLAHMSKTQEASEALDEKSAAGLVTGVTAAIIAIFMSGFAGTYVLKLLE